MERTFKSSDIPKRTFVHFLEDMKEKRKFCDVTFQVGEESVSAHRIIITAVIPYFKNVLSNEHDHSEEIILPDIEPSALLSVIEFAYTCEVKITAENVRQLLAAACFLGVDEIREECCDFMAENFDPEDILNIRNFATDLNCPELLNSTSRYAIENFYEICETKDFLNYSSNFLKELMSQDELNVDNEEKVLEALMRWTKASPEDRKDELPKLLRNVRLTLFTPMYLAAVVEREELIRSSLMCRDLVDEAKNYMLTPKLWTKSCSFVNSPRKSIRNSDVQSNNGDSILKLQIQDFLTAQHFNMKKKKWVTKKTIPVLHNGGSTVEMHSTVYFFLWGYTMAYNPVKNEYKYMASMPTPRIFSGACLLKNKLYVCGGKSGEAPSNAVERFDPEKNTWTRVRNMNICREGLSVVCFKEHIFAMGGHDGNSFLDSVERYDPIRNKWTIMSPMLTKRYLASAASLNGKLYICGGKADATRIHKSAEVYDPIKNGWEFISPINTARKEFTLLSCSGRLYALGGMNADNKFVHSFDIYDPKFGKWGTGPSTDPHHLTTGAVVILCEKT